MSATVPETRRVDRGRNHSYLLDGGKADGVTTVLGEGFPKPALVGWAGNTTAEYAVDHWDELAEMLPSARLAVLKAARFKSRDEAALRGQDVHKQLQDLALLGEVDVPEPIEGFVDAYLEFVRDWQPQELLAEAVVGNRPFGYMGTLDVVARLVDGLVWLLDFKTGKGVYAESALQLAAYRRAEFYLDADWREQPMPRVDACGVVHVRADGYDLYPVEAGDEAFRLFLQAQSIARFRAEAESTVIGESLRPPGVKS